MGCLLVILGLITPRFILLILWLFTNYLNHAFSSGWWGILGFLFLPTTAIGYAVAKNEFTAPDGGIEAAGIIAIVLGVVVDLGLLGGSGRGVGRRETRA
jgi:hypothetical protein